MTKNSVPPVLSFFFILSFCFSPGSFVLQDSPPPDSAVVTRVIDGDSFQARFADGRVRGVRLIGVNAPELGDGRENVRCLAFLARRFASHHLYGKKIKLSYEGDILDRYGRLLAYVRLPGQPLFNEFIIRRGFASAFLKYPFRREYQEAFLRAQRQAQRQGRGLWGKVPPPEVGLSAMAGHLGEFISVRFACARLRDGEKYIFLGPQSGELLVLVSKEGGLILPTVQELRDSNIIVSGVLEKSGQQYRIYVFCPGHISWNSSP